MLQNKNQKVKEKKSMFEYMGFPPNLLKKLYKYEDAEE